MSTPLETNNQKAILSSKFDTNRNQSQSLRTLKVKKFLLENNGTYI